MAAQCDGMHVCPSFSAPVAVQCPPSPSPSGRTAGSALVVHSVPARMLAAARSLVGRTPAARTAADHMIVACWSDLVVVVGPELVVVAESNRLATATVLEKLVRMARALLVDATQTAYGCFGDAHLLVLRKAKRSAGQSAS